MKIFHVHRNHNIEFQKIFHVHHNREFQKIEESIQDTAGSQQRIPEDIEPIQDVAGPSQEQIQEDIQEQVQEIGPSVVQQVRVNRGPRVQKIDPSTLCIVDTYNSLQETVRMCNIRMYSLKDAAKNRHVCNGFRWYFVRRENDVNVRYDIGPTEQKQSTKEYNEVVKVNRDETEILAIFSSQQDASNKENIIKSQMHKFVHNKTVVNGHKFLMYVDLPETLKRKCDEMSKDTSNHKYARLKDGVVVKSYLSKSDIVKDCHISYRKLNQLLENGESYNGYIFDMI